MRAPENEPGVVAAIVFIVIATALAMLGLWPYL
jgi:hypothetical protein